VIPALNGASSPGMALRGSNPRCSVVDLHREILGAGPPAYAATRRAMKAASEGPMAGILGYPETL